MALFALGDFVADHPDNIEVPVFGVKKLLQDITDDYKNEDSIKWNANTDLGGLIVSLLTTPHCKDFVADYLSGGLPAGGGAGTMQIGGQAMLMDDPHSSAMLMDQNRQNTQFRVKLEEVRRLWKNSHVGRDSGLMSGFRGEQYVTTRARLLDLLEDADNALKFLYILQVGIVDAFDRNGNVEEDADIKFRMYFYFPRSSS